MPRTYENDAAVKNSSPCITPAHETGNTNNEQQAQPVHVPRTLKQRFIDYFTKAYPVLTRITIRRTKDGHFRARAWYRPGRHHRINATAQTYETLVIRMDAKFKSRSIPRAYNR